MIKKVYPNLKIRLVDFTTNGDRILDKSLSSIGGKGLFIKELELALLNKEADIAVHSLKDLPARLDDAFTLAAVLPREDPRDAFISNKYMSLAAMPKNSIIGTSSVRRSSFLKKYYPELTIKLLRGNVDTRLNKLDNAEYDAIILAVAGLKRLGLESRITEYLDQNQFIPAIAQGAIGIEMLKNNEGLLPTLYGLDHKLTRIAIEIEREVGYNLGASCSLPIGVHVNVNATEVNLKAMVLDEDGTTSYLSEIRANLTEFSKLAKLCADDLIRQGAATILTKYKK